jgi:hypothetical protein
MPLEQSTMGIKNIHIVLISASVLLAAVFGLWSLKNAHNAWAIMSFAVAIGLIAYGMSFVKKARRL